jgi:putative flippase GtrA
MRQVALFLVAGGVAALANILARIGFNTFMPYVPAIVLAYCIGMVTAFVLNRALVFKNATNGFREQALWFVVINLAAVAQTVAVSLLLSRWIFPAVGLVSHADTLAHVAGVLVPVFTSYFGHKHLSFRSRLIKEPEH